MKIRLPYLCYMAALVMLYVLSGSIAQAGQLTDIANREIHRQQEQDATRLQEIADAQPDVRLQADPAEASAKMEYPEDEQPCFLIKEIKLEGDQAEKFQWALKAVKDAIGRCLGGKGVNIAMLRMQEAILARGFTTTRIVAAPQNLKEGILVFKVIPGIVTEISLSQDSGKYQFLGAVMPVKKGEILNIRKVEQGLENIRRIPTVQTDMKLVPGENQGESKLEVMRKQGRPVRLTLSADDSGSKYTGKYQGTATLYLDNMLGISDLFSASLGNNIATGGKDHGTKNYSLYYSAPWRYWQLSFYHSNNDYHQMVAGHDIDYVYSGESQNTTLELSRMLYRSSRFKTSASVGAWLSCSKNFIDATEMEIQRRRLAGWEIGLNHRHFIGPVTLDADFKYKQGTGALNSIHAPEEIFDEGTSRPRILSMNLRLNLPFTIKKQQFAFSTSWRQQWAFNHLLQRDRLSIGGRYTVRGFDGEYTLSADNGFVSRTELSYVIPKIRQQVYVAFDAGRVWGPNTDMLLGQSLAGAALGLRGAIKKFSYDGFVSTPVARPRGFPGKKLVWGFSASVNF